MERSSTLTFSMADMSARAIQNPTKIKDKQERMIMKSSNSILLRINAIIDAKGEYQNIQQTGDHKIILEGINMFDGTVINKELFVTTTVFDAWNAYKEKLEAGKDGAEQIHNLAAKFVEFAETNEIVKSKVEKYTDAQKRSEVLSKIIVAAQANDFNPEAFRFDAEEQQETVSVILGRIGVGPYKHLKLKKIQTPPAVSDDFFYKTANEQLMPISDNDAKTIYGVVYKTLVSHYTTDEWGVEEEKLPEFLKKFDNADVNFLVTLRELLETISRKDNPVSFTTTQSLLSYGFLAASFARQYGSTSTGSVFGSLTTFGFLPLALTTSSYLFSSLNFSGSEGMQHWANNFDPRSIIQEFQRPMAGISSEAKKSFKTIIKAYDTGKQGIYTTVQKLYQISVSQTGAGGLFSNLSSLALKSFFSSVSTGFQILSSLLKSVLKSVVHLLEYQDFLFMLLICLHSGDNTVIALQKISEYLATVFLRKNILEGTMTVLNWAGLKRSSSWFFFVRTAVNFVLRFTVHFPAGFLSNILDANAVPSISPSLFESIFSIRPIRGTREAAGIIWNALTGPIALALKYMGEFWKELGLPMDLSKRLYELWETLNKEPPEFTQIDLLGSNKTLIEVLEKSSFPMTLDGFKDPKVVPLFEPTCTIVDSVVRRTEYFETPWSVLKVPLDLLKSSLPNGNLTDFDSLAILCADDPKYIGVFKNLLDPQSGGARVDAKIISEMVKYGKNRMKQIASLSKVSSIDSHCIPDIGDQKTVWSVFLVASARVVQTLKDTDRFSDIFQVFGDSFRSNITQIFQDTGVNQFALNATAEIISAGEAIAGNILVKQEDAGFWARLGYFTGLEKYAEMTGLPTAMVAAIALPQGIPVLPVALGVGGITALAVCCLAWPYAKKKVLRITGITKGTDQIISLKRTNPEPEPEVYQIKKQFKTESEESESPPFDDVEDISTQAATYNDSESFEIVWVSSLKKLIEFAQTVDISLQEDEIAHLLICRTASGKYMQILRALLDLADEDVKKQPGWRYMFAQTNPELKYTPQNLDSVDDTPGLRLGPSLDRNLFDVAVFDTDAFTIDHVEAAYRVFLGKDVSESTGQDDDNQMRQRLSLFIDALLIDRLLSLPIP